MFTTPPVPVSPYGQDPTDRCGIGSSTDSGRGCPGPVPRRGFRGSDLAEQHLPPTADTTRRSAIHLRCHPTPPTAPAPSGSTPDGHHTPAAHAGPDRTLRLSTTTPATSDGHTPGPGTVLVAARELPALAQNIAPTTAVLPGHTPSVRPSPPTPPSPERQDGSTTTSLATHLSPQGPGAPVKIEVFKVNHHRGDRPRPAPSGPGCGWGQGMRAHDGCWRMQCRALHGSGGWPTMSGTIFATIASTMSRQSARRVHWSSKPGSSAQSRVLKLAS